MTNDTNMPPWVELHAAGAAQFEARNRGKTLSIDTTVILGQTTSGAWIARIDGHEMVGSGQSWKPVHHFIAVSGTEAHPVIDEASPAQIAEATHTQQEYM